MKFKKISLVKGGTLTVTYENADSDTITMVGANIVHKDLKKAFRELVPHLALLTEQREAVCANLEDLEKQLLSEDEHSVYKVLSVDDITLTDEESRIAIGGKRILQGGRVMKLQAPPVDIMDSESYEYCGPLSLVLENIIYEVKEYVEQKKWGACQAELEFKEMPFEGVKAEEVPSVKVEVVTAPKKKGKKKKEAA